MKATRYSHGDQTAAYIGFMLERMLEIKRVLKPTGSVYLHCDHEANAYLRQMMDAVFGPENFRNEIIWRKYAGRKNNAKSKFSTQHDTILFYAAGPDAVFRSVYQPLSDEARREYKHLDSEGRRYRMARRGRGYESANAGRRIYLDESLGAAVTSLWVENGLMLGQSASERTGYPTQKPQALARRIIEASSNPGDVVLDCFAGCAYVPVAAELTGRRWVACDMSPRAWTVVRRQFHKQPSLHIQTEGGGCYPWHC